MPVFLLCVLLPNYIQTPSVPLVITMRIIPGPGFHLLYCFFRFCHVITLFPLNYGYKNNYFCFYQIMYFYCSPFNNSPQSTFTSYPSILRLYFSGFSFKYVQKYPSFHSFFTKTNLLPSESSIFSMHC